MHIELLVDSTEFWPRLRSDLEDARETAFIQTFSFEGDRVGTSLGRRLEACRARDRRLLVDGYSRLYHNDRIIHGPAWRERAFRREVLLTSRWVERLRAGGTAVRFGRPPGPSPARLLRRSHKKVAVFDDRVAYLGGINFCDHNFAWHDMMLRVESRALARHLTRDFEASWEGRAERSDTVIGPLRIISLNGRENPGGFRPVLRAVASARDTIDVVSAYLSPPFTEHLACARRRGVRVRILTPEDNNKGNLARFILHASHRHSFEIFRYPGRMNHMKAMVVDDDLLIAGSSNFDFMSYHVLDELVVMTRDVGVLREFKSRVWLPDLAVSRRMGPVRTTGTRLGHAAVRVGAGLSRALVRS